MVDLRQIMGGARTMSDVTSHPGAPDQRICGLGLICHPPALAGGGHLVTLADEWRRQGSDMTVDVPGATTRWRCARCGNLTRFDVLRERRSREYWHFDLSGEYEVETEEPLKDQIEQVVCRWCGSTDAVELVPRPEGGPEVESV